MTWTLVIIGLVLNGCEPAAESESTLEPLSPGPVTNHPASKSNPYNAQSCVLTPEGCQVAVVNNGPPISEESEICPSFLNAEMGTNPVLLVSVLEHRLEWVFASGDKVESTLPMDGVPAQPQELLTDLIAGDNHVVVNRHWVTMDEQGQNLSYHALTVLDRYTQEVVWHRVEMGLYFFDVRLHADGSLVFNKTRQGAEKEDRYSVVYVDAQGRDKETIGFHAIGPRTNDRAEPEAVIIPVRGIYHSEMAWWNAGDNALVSVATEEQASGVLLIGDHFVWLQAGKASSWLMIASPGELAESSLIEGMSNYKQLEIRQYTGDRWLLISNGLTDWRVELVRTSDELRVVGGALPLEFAIPEGLERITSVGCLMLNASMDDQGRLLMYLRDEHQATPYRYDPEGKRFEVIGLPTNRAMGGHIVSHVNTYTIGPASPWQFKCMPMEVLKLLDGPPGPSHQVSQPDLGVSFAFGEGGTVDPFTLPPQSIAMHSTGICFVQTLRDVHMDVIEHRVRDVYAGKYSPITFLGTPVWLE